MTNNAEIARLAQQQRHTDKVSAFAAQLRDDAQARYDAAVVAQQSEMSAHLAAIRDLDDAATGTSSERALSVITAARAALVAQHITALGALTDAVTALVPQLDVSYWTAQAEASVTADEANGA